MLINSSALDAIEVVRAQSIAAIRAAELPESLAIALRQNANKAIDLTIDDAIRADATSATLRLNENGDYPTA